MAQYFTYILVFDDFGVRWRVEARLEVVVSFNLVLDYVKGDGVWLSRDLASFNYGFSPFRFPSGCVWLSLVCRRLTNSGCASIHGLKLN
jgi:hypothetical protein